MDTVSTAAQDDSSGANPSSVKSDDSSPRRESGSSSPPPNCAICLGTCKNKSFTDSCLHQFCFSCLLTWSKVKAECPLCKQAFRSIIHNVRSNHQYEEYLVVQRQTEESSSRIDIDRVTAATHRFRYRTTLTLPRRETIAIQQLLRHYPFMADVFPPPAARAPPARRRRSPAAFRRTVYRHNLWARPLPDFTGRYRDCTPEFYRYNDTQMHRLVPWINRELHYLLNENVSHISYVMTRILELLPEHHINSPEFRECMERYFGDRTEHFLHEMYCFASTPYDIAGYDRNVQYTTDTRISTMVNEVISSSESDASVDSDIVMVSSSEPLDPPPGPSRVPAPVYPQSYISQPPATNNVIPIETISQSDTDDDSSEVMVVGYIKPPQDRTPEIVDLLGSDSDVIVQETQPEPSASSVKVTLKRHRTRSRSSSDDSYSPNQPKRRRSDTTQDSSTSTCSSFSSETFSTSSDSSGTTTPVCLLTGGSFSSGDDEPTPRILNPESTVRTRKRLRKRSSRPRQKRNRSSVTTEAAKRNSRKSNSGKGVKSSRKNNQKSSDRPAQSAPAPTPAPTVRSDTPELPPATLDQPQPSTSGAQSHQKRKSKKERKRQQRRSRENRRLRSVVNVINSHKNTDESNSSANYSNYLNAGTSQRHAVQEPAQRPASRASSATDSEDNLPLNLTLQKITPSSAT